jgi:cell division septation protein DedD
VTIETRILHKSGEWIADEGLYIPADKRNAQGFGSATTYGRRYALMALIGVAPDDDDDGNAASAPAPKAAARKAPAKAAQTPSPALVSPEQAAELTAAAIATGMDPALAERKANNTLAAEFVVKLTSLKEKGKSNA